MLMIARLLDIVSNGPFNPPQMAYICTPSNTLRIKHLMFHIKECFHFGWTFCPTFLLLKRSKSIQPHPRFVISSPFYKAHAHKCTPNNASRGKAKMNTNSFPFPYGIRFWPALPHRMENNSDPFGIVAWSLITITSCALFVFGLFTQK